MPFQSALRQLQQELADSLKKLSMCEASLEVNTRYRSDLEEEKTRTLKDMDRLKTKVPDQCCNATAPAIITTSTFWTCAVENPFVINCGKALSGLFWVSSCRRVKTSLCRLSGASTAWRAAWMRRNVRWLPPHRNYRRCCLPQLPRRRLSNSWRRLSRGESLCYVLLCLRALELATIQWTKKYLKLLSST